MKPLPLQICFIGESFLPRSLRRSLVCQGVPAQKPWGVGNKKRETFASDMDIFHDTGTWHLQGSKVKTLIFSQPFVSLNCRCFGGYWFITPHYVSVVVFFSVLQRRTDFFWSVWLTCMITANGHLRCILGLLVPEIPAITSRDVLFQPLKQWEQLSINSLAGL